MSAAELWADLAANGLVEGERPERAAPASPWYVRAMLGVAGWIGAFFLLLFVGAAFAFVMRDPAVAAVAGAACCGGALFLFRSFDGNDFVEQFALVLSLVGQVLLAIGFAQFLPPEQPGLYLAMAAAEIALAVAIPHFLHRVLAAGGAAVALALAINQLALHGLAAPLLCAGLAFVWLEPKRWACSGSLWRPIGYGLVLALLLVETFRLFGAETWFASDEPAPGWTALYGPLIGRGLTASILVWAAARLALREDYAPGSRVFFAAAGGALAIGLLSLGAPGLGSALLVLLLGFAAGNRILVALGILGLLGFIGHFYYSLQASLLEKSGLLALTGLFLLAVWFVLRRVPAAPAAPDTAHA